MMEVAWIGLGQMGLPSAKKVAAAGHRVRGYDVNPPARDAADGIVLAASPREAAEGCDLLCIAVFSDAQLFDVLTGPAGVLSELRSGAVVAVFTTGSIESIRKLAAVAPSGVAVLDTCFSRMQADIDRGMMTLLVGGDGEAINRGRPAFESFARNIIHVGKIGSGRAIKLVNNILFAGHLQLAADALRFAEALGLDPYATAAALTQCSGASDVMSRFATEPTSGMLETAKRYMVKDVAAAVQAARDAGVELGALGAATEVYRT
jgi:3-hydroxyisobutyrate dehydrogenase-like beta-hydroxyacid dehydrogenase